MVTVDEINVGKSRRSKQDGSAGGVTCRSVGGRIVFAKVGFDFHDTGGKAERSGFPDQHLAQKFTCHALGIAAEECSIERLRRGGSWLACWFAHGSEILN